MAMSMRVTNMGGRVIATKRAGVRSYHQHDALGNTIALINDSAVVTDTYTYWPYGELRTSTGSTTNPFKFCGAWGYYTDTTGRTYVRARTLRPGLTRWMTVDPLWPKESAFFYCLGSPVLHVDPSGLGYGISRCRCQPTVTVSLPKKHPAYKCILTACLEFCRDVGNAVFDANAQCKWAPIFEKCDAVNNTYPACTQASGPWHTICGREICQPGGSVYNGHPANYSNYPDPEPQLSTGSNSTWQFCCVECKMRLCCWTMASTWAAYLKREAKCLKRP